MKNPVILCDGYAAVGLLNMRGQVVAQTLVSLCDIDRVLSYGVWRRRESAFRTKNATKSYLIAHRGRVPLHRFILDAPKGMVVDHINHDTLDNRRENIRLTTKSGNAQNCVAHCDSSSGVRNVYRAGDKWTVQVCRNYRRFTFGWFATIEEAAEVARIARQQHLPESPENLVATRAAVAEALRLAEGMRAS